MVPAHLPIRVAARLAGRSEPVFRRDVLPEVRDDRGNVSRGSLERYLSREIGGAEYLAAIASLEPRRARERSYKRTAV